MVRGVELVCSSPAGRHGRRIPSGPMSSSHVWARQEAPDAGGVASHVRITTESALHRERSHRGARGLAAAGRPRSRGSERGRRCVAVGLVRIAPAIGARRIAGGDRHRDRRSARGAVRRGGRRRTRRPWMVAAPPTSRRLAPPARRGGGRGSDRGDVRDGGERHGDEGDCRRYRCR